MSELRKIPGVGKETEKDLLMLGYTTVASLKNADPEEMYELGYEEYFYGDGVCVIEWADLIEELLPEYTKVIRIEYGKYQEERIYQCTF